MAGLPPKTPFHCPACGFVQLEPPHLISTSCRACGTFYEVGRERSRVHAQRTVFPLPFLQGAQKPVFCHRCGTTHSVSTHAHSTICPACGTGIELDDVHFTTSTSRAVDTRGCLTIGPNATLSHSWIVCGSARIEGAVTGQIISEGVITFATKETCIARVVASRIVVEKSSRACVTLPVEVDSISVSGALSCGLLRCRGEIHVRRGGHLSARIQARSIIVEKGGILLGTCQVDQASWETPKPEGVRAKFSLLRPSPSY